MNRLLIVFSSVISIFFVSPVILAQATRPIKTIIVDAGHGGKDFGANGNYEGGLKSHEKDITLGVSLKLVNELKKRLPEVNTIPTRTTDIYQSPPEKADIANSNKGDLFVCIHADAVELQTGRRQVGTRQETRYKIKYSGKGKRKKKSSTPYTVTVPVYEYYKIGCSRNGTSVWLFAAHKTSEKLKALMRQEGEPEQGDEITDDSYHGANKEDSLYDNMDFSKPEFQMMAKVYAQRYQEKSIKLAEIVNEEIEKTGRSSLGVNQRQKGIWVLQATKMPAILIETGFICNHDDESYLNSEQGQQEMAVSIANAIVRYKEQMDAAKNGQIGPSK